MAQFEQVASVDDLEPGTSKPVIVDDLPMLLIRVGDSFFAIEDVCTHDGQPLTDGPIEGKEITCPRHGARFDVTTGAALCMPATEPVRTFKTKVENGLVYVQGAD